MKKMFCTYCQIGECSQCSGLEFSAWCNHDCNYLKKKKLGYKGKDLMI